MEAELDKENIADSLSVASTHKCAAPSPRKGAKKTRSLSMGPGALSVPLKEDSGNRRKSAFPAVKSILPSKEDEEKRRAARRKSLDAEPPSTPPEQVEEPEPESSPANQRDLHQRKHRRRSSGIPPLNFGNPEDLESSSPASGSSPTSSDSEVVVDGADDDDTAMSLDDEIEATGQSLASMGSSASDTTSSSGRLDEALRQAVAQASSQDSQHIGYDGFEEKSVDATNKGIAHAFKPWIQKGSNLSSLQDQENINPFSPAFKAQIAVSRTQENTPMDEDTQDMSMDMTHVMGGIIQQGIVGRASESDSTPTQQKTLKRRRSSTNVALATNATSEGSPGPAKRQAGRRSSVRRRRSSAENSELGDETMDLTMAVGGIQQIQSQNSNRRESVDISLGDETMDFTMVQGGILSGSQSQELDELNNDEDLSMELTATLEKTIKVQPIPAITRSPARSTRSPRKSLMVVQTPEKNTSKSPSRQLKTPTPTKTPTKSPRKSPRKNLGPSALRNEITLAQESEAVPEVQTPENNTKAIAQPTQPAPPKFDVPVAESPKNQPPTILVAATPPRRRVSDLAPVFSPLKPSVIKTSLSDSIKLLSTPRKQHQTSPLKRAVFGSPKAQATPKKAATPKKTPTPKRSATPRKRGGRVGFAAEEDKENEPEVPEKNERQEEVEKIQLQDFLNMTNIRFMDLTTTKRRHTGFPGAEGRLAPEYNEEDDSPLSLESTVAAAACTVPMLTMYQHSCHEMKNYIAGGRDDLRTLEAEVYESQPPLFQEYMSAPPDERAIMDNQFKNMKTNARLQSKAGWHAWRSQLLTDLKAGLLQSSADFDDDASLLSRQEELLNATLPDLLSYNEELETQCRQLQERADELSSDDRDELEATRERLVAADTEIEEKKRLLAELQSELAEKEASVEAVTERKTECLEEIKEAERVREEYRGWSAGEVSILKAEVDALEREHGWAVTSASSNPTTLTLTYKSDLELFFHPSSFQSESEIPNTPISLTYIGDDTRHSNANPRPLTTTKRFFLQLLRAHLHSVPQSSTPISTLLTSISSTWSCSLSLAEATRHLSLTSLTTESILSDERIAIDTKILLPTLQTKVNARFEVAVAVVGAEVESTVKVEARVVYGERYNEGKMGEFLMQFTGGKVGGIEGMGKWAEGVEDLRVRLIRRGRKG
ncbi:Spc7-domain-containing protein [Tothia fuscella]|uniref:Spc7-domain-containing protein n=1 Tax=Tothia fuscella TaxID=1048955 RepID=A0A9P4P207_9PEZI|nr:Spc7-domain-containing protein [Tothia fuscella]